MGKKNKNKKKFYRTNISFELYTDGPIDPESLLDAMHEKLTDRLEDANGMTAAISCSIETAKSSKNEVNDFLEAEGWGAKAKDIF